MTSRRAAHRAAKRRTTFRRTTKPIDPRNRLLALLIAFVVAAAGFVAVLVDLQTVRPDMYRSLGEDQRTMIRQIAGYRGAVVDRNGFVLAASTPSHQVVADPSQVDDSGATAALLGPILGIDSATLATLLEPSSPDDKYSLLARNVDDEAVLQIEQLKSADSFQSQLVGIYIRPEEDRVYPAGELATAVVGQVDPDESGIRGVEHLYDEVMTGVPGTEQLERGRFGSISVGDRRIDPATAGYDVVLTLDHRIQYLAEQVLLAHCRSTGAAGATAVMSDPETGEILVMASVVRDPDDGACKVPIYSTALINTFEPGSVLKSMVVAAATEELGLAATTPIEVPPKLVVGGVPFVDHPEHPAAPFPIWQILSKSMNVGAITVSQQIEAETLYDYLVAFGFGQPSGLELTEGESPGVLRHPDEWYGADYGSIPIGQGVSVNAMQLVSAYNVLANGGRYLPPVLVTAIEGADGTSYPAALTEPRTVISEQTARELTTSLTAVVDEGTGTEAAVPGYTVAGKTGTAWKVFEDSTGQVGYGSDGNRRYVVSFAGYLPAEDPQLSLVVVVDEPVTDSTASVVAAPIFSEIAEYGARILDIAPVGGAAGDGDRVRSEPATSGRASPSGGAPGGAGR